MGRVLRNPAFVAVVLGHLTVDAFTSALPVLLVVFAARLGLSNVGVGTVATIYVLGTSLTQPLFGLIVDRWRTQWIGIGGVLWLAGAFALAAFLPGRAALVAFMLAGLGSGAYHPQGSANARRVAGANGAGGLSLFSFFGQSGHAIGPVLAGLLLAQVSVRTTLVTLALLAVPVAFFLWRFAARIGCGPATAAGPAGATRRVQSWAPLPLFAFILVILLSAWPYSGTGTFLPKWLSDAGFSSDAFGGMLSAFMLASAFGNLFGGWLADRWSRRGNVVLAMVLGVLPFYVLYAAPSTSLPAFVAIVLAGFSTGMPISVILLMGQDLFPRKMGFSSGLVLGFLFTANAIAGWLTGFLGDRIGLQQVLQLSPWILVIAAVCALALPRTRPQASPAGVAAAAD